MDAITIQKRIKTVEYFIDRSEEIIKREQQSIEKNKKVLANIQAECKHDFVNEGLMIGSQTCKICGLWEGGL